MLSGDDSGAAGFPVSSCTAQGHQFRHSGRTPGAYFKILAKSEPGDVASFGNNGCRPSHGRPPCGFFADVYGYIRQEPVDRRCVPGNTGGRRCPGYHNGGNLERPTGAPQDAGGGHPVVSAFNAGISVCPRLVGDPSSGAAWVYAFFNFTH